MSQSTNTEWPATCKVKMVQGRRRRERERKKKTLTWRQGDCCTPMINIDYEIDILLLQLQSENSITFSILHLIFSRFCDTTKEQKRKKQQAPKILTGPKWRRIWSTWFKSVDDEKETRSASVFWTHGCISHCTRVELFDNHNSLSILAKKHVFHSLLLFHISLSCITGLLCLKLLNVYTVIERTLTILRTMQY